MLVRGHQRLALALLTLTVMACNRSSREVQEVPGPAEAVVESPVATAEVGVDPACDEEHRDAVREELQDMCAWTVCVPTVEVPMSRWGGAPCGSFTDVVITVSQDQIWVHYRADDQRSIGERDSPYEQAPSTIGDLAATLAAIPRDQADGEDQAFIWGLQIASDVPTAVVAEVMTTLINAKMPDGRLHLGISERPAAVRDPTLHATINPSYARTAPGMRIAWAKQELERLAGPCPAFENAFEAAWSVAPSQTCTALTTGLALAIDDCGCAREAEIVTVMHTLAFGEKPPARHYTAVPARIDPNATPRRGKTWGSIVAGLEKKEDALSLWVAGEDKKSKR